MLKPLYHIVMTFAIKKTWAFCVDLYKTYTVHNGSYLAASIAYFMVLSIIPVILVCVSIIGFVFGSDFEARVHFLKLLDQNIPVMDDSIRKALDFAIKNKNALGLIGIAALLWISKNIIFALNFALEKIMDIQKHKDFIHRLLDTLYILAIIVVLVVVSMFWEMAASYVGAYMSVLPISNGMQRTFMEKILPYAFALATSLALFYALYRIVPRIKPRPLYALAGAVTGTLLWEGIKMAFSFYLSRGTVRYELVYGSLAAIIYMIVWAYMFAFSIITGACVIKVLKDRDGHHAVFEPHRHDEG